ncbi:MAG: hypothetical protein QFX38_04555 [Methanothermobacter sp.]|nr:hypothetical protein [Methanothermobacter sp.]
MKVHSIVLKRLKNKNSLIKPMIVDINNMKTARVILTHFLSCNETLII